MLVPPVPVVPVNVVGSPRNCEKIPFTPVLSLLLSAPDNISLTVLRQPSIAPERISLNQFSRAFIKSSTIQTIALFLTCAPTGHKLKGENKMTIISQDYELINFDKLAKVTMYEGEVDGTTVYAIVGFESASSDDAEISGDSDTVLGIYNNTTECENVLLALIETLKAGKTVFQMPEPVIESKEVNA